MKENHIIWLAKKKTQLKNKIMTTFKIILKFSVTRESLGHQIVFITRIDAETANEMVNKLQEKLDTIEGIKSAFGDGFVDTLDDIFNKNGSPYGHLKIRNGILDFEMMSEESWRKMTRQRNKLYHDTINDLFKTNHKNQTIKIDL